MCVPFKYCGKFEYNCYFIFIKAPKIHFFPLKKIIFFNFDVILTKGSEVFMLLI